MAEEKNEVAQKQEFTTALSNWTNTITGLVTRDFEQCGVRFDEYSKRCAMAAMGNIFQLVQSTDKTEMNDLNTSNLREIVEQCASLKLNANAVPREVYFQLRSKQIGGVWKKIVEMGIEGDGNDALLRQFGNNVKKVHPVWLVKEGDEFTYPKRKGLEVEPPSWEEKGLSQKVLRVVYPVELNDGHVEYLISERDSVKVNLIAHIRNNMMNETFGICGDRYKATAQQKKEIKEKKNEILDAVRKCETLEDMLNCEVARPFISAAWLDTPEAMFIRKMRNNAIKKFPKNLNSMASSSLLQMDDTYKNAQEEIRENENSQPFEVEGNVVAEVDATEVPEFAKKDKQDENY
uniref:RecT family protein n=1 Tax=virus sp. ctah610 TaxID=2826807 RepID=A0A8S5R6T6_9VIRU|nr:MAG TPA: RecT family protein [virus sp. ctah610]